MIIDQITNSHLYYALHPRIKPAFDYLHQTDLSALEVGKYEIDGENIYAMVQQYISKPRERGFWEATSSEIIFQPGSTTFIALFEVAAMERVRGD